MIQTGVKIDDGRKTSASEQKRMASALMGQIHDSSLLFLEHTDRDLQRNSWGWFRINVWLRICLTLNWCGTKIFSSGYIQQDETITKPYVIALITICAWLLIVASAVSMVI